MLVCACICLYVHVFFFLFCPRRKREKVAQARTWCPAMCCQKGNQMSAKRLRRFWDSNTRLQGDMCQYLPLSQRWLWHFAKFVNYICQVKYIHIQTIHTYTCNTCNTCNTCKYSHIHACANHGGEGSLGGCGRRCMSQEATKLPQEAGTGLGTGSTSSALSWLLIQPSGGGAVQGPRRGEEGGVREIRF